MLLSLAPDLPGELGLLTRDGIQPRPLGPRPTCGRGLGQLWGGRAGSGVRNALGEDAFSQPAPGGLGLPTCDAGSGVGEGIPALDGQLD